MKMSHSDVNPMLSGNQLPDVDLARLMAKPKAIEPKGPRLNLQAVGNWLLLDMPEELSPEIQGGIIVTEASRKKFSPYAVATVLGRGPETKHLEISDRILVLRQHVDQVVVDGHSYWRLPEGAVIAKVL